MTPQERLYAEEIPTGTFGDAQPTPSRTQSPSRPWTPQEQHQHRQALEAALNGWHWDENPRHLRAVPNAA